GIFAIQPELRSDRPAIQAVVPFRPPPIENRKVESTMDGNFLPARSTRLHGAARIVQPHIAARNQRPGDLHVVVLEENDAPSKIRMLRGLHDALDEPLSTLVGRMRLAGVDDLNRSLVSAQDGS